MSPDPMDKTFKALAHPVRRQILDLIKSSPGATVQEVADGFEMSRIGVMKHLKVLEEADLVLSEKEGRRRCLYFNVVPIQQIHDRWTTEYSALWAGRLTSLKYRLENKEKDDEV